MIDVNKPFTKLAFNAIEAAAGAPQLSYTNGRMVNQNADSNGSSISPVGGAALGALAAGGLYHGTQAGLLGYGLSDKATREAIKNAGGLRPWARSLGSDAESVGRRLGEMAEKGSPRLKSADKALRVLRKAKLPLLGAGLIGGGYLASRNSGE